jgi:amidophosphoribosyltransferase
MLFSSQNNIDHSEDILHDNCGIFGISSLSHNVVRMTYLGLYSLQHRGQESAGIACTWNGDKIRLYRDMGLVSQAFPEHLLENILPARRSIGHVRYSTSGGSSLVNAQPLVFSFFGKELAIAHNGNIVNTKEIRSSLEAKGAIFQTTSDTEIIVHLMAHSSKASFLQRLKDALSQLVGAYCLIILYDEYIYAIRDPFGFHPLVLGNAGGCYCIASETCALEQIQGEVIQGIEPGEIAVLTPDNNFSIDSFLPSNRKQQCIFELIYLARPDSVVFSRPVYECRRRMGKYLAQESHVDADIVIPVPDSGMSSAIGYAYEAGIPFELGLLRNHYVGRTFIQPSHFLRVSKIQIKLNPIKSIIQGKRLIVIDDSIVRGSTCKEIAKLLRKYGAKEIHLRISSPEIHYHCCYGIDTPHDDELIANHKNLEEIRKYLEVDSIHYLSLAGLRNAVLDKESETQFCTACFTGDYPTEN